MNNPTKILLGALLVGAAAALARQKGQQRCRIRRLADQNCIAIGDAVHNMAVRRDMEEPEQDLVNIAHIYLTSYSSEQIQDFVDSRLRSTRPDA